MNLCKWIVHVVKNHIFKKTGKDMVNEKKQAQILSRQYDHYSGSYTPQKTMLLLHRKN